jgi:bifunctional DNA-binding transcriptional regulator/antitoxin component of YhaV-PrlF toxin-antitoxin module
MKLPLVSKITSKYQITLLKEVRESLFLNHQGILGKAKKIEKKEIRKARLDQSKEKRS